MYFDLEMFGFYVVLGNVVEFFRSFNKVWCMVVYVCMINGIYKDLEFLEVISCVLNNIA